jgi:hypothetical protein
MKCEIVTVARSLGARGEETARTAAKALGFRYVDDEIVIHAAERAGVSPETIAQVEHTQPLILRILDIMARVPADPGMGAAVVPLIEDPSLRTPAYEAMIKEVVRDTAAEGNVVIVAHGAGVHLTGSDGLLRVFVTASPAARVERIARRDSAGEQAARKVVQESDRQRRDYLRRFCEVRQESPTHYDLVINTDVLTPVQAAEIIAGSAKGL